MSGYFEEPLENSKVKSKIVSEYFYAWSKVMKSRSEKISYIDLYCGQGYFEDGTKSTPILILEQIIENPELLNQVITIFNDANPEFVKKLEYEIKKIEGINQLKYKPEFYNITVGDELAKLFQDTSLVPTLAFIDPWGYKGLSADLINGLIKDWGSDCIFFFNYNRINPGISNEMITSHIQAIFGRHNAEALRNKISGMKAKVREETIINELKETLSTERKNYVLPFCFKKHDKKRTSHYLIFVSKSELGYSIMKNILYKYSAKDDEEIANFTYIPGQKGAKQLSLLPIIENPLDNLGNDLLKCFAGKTLSVDEIYKQHHINKNFVKPNYQKALRRLEEKKLIIVDRSQYKRPRRDGVLAMGDKVIITFP